MSPLLKESQMKALFIFLIFHEPFLNFAVSTSILKPVGFASISLLRKIENLAFRSY